MMTSNNDCIVKKNINIFGDDEDYYPDWLFPLTKAELSLKQEWSKLAIETPRAHALASFC